MKVTPDTKARIVKYGLYGQTMDEIVNHVLDLADEQTKAPHRKFG